MKDAKRVFLKKGSCSNTLFYLLNREFGHTSSPEEQASDPLAGGLNATGHQCGMLWGSSLAVGAESFRRFGHSGRANAMAIKVTQHVMESFVTRSQSANCREIIGCDLTTKAGMRKLMVKTILSGFIYSKCFNLAKKWAPEAFEVALKSLSTESADIPVNAVSCASETVIKMGATTEQATLVAGFAGGMGLSGNACGALAAAMWYNTLEWCRNNPGKFAYTNPVANAMLREFKETTGGEMLCGKICGRRFNSIEEHNDFIQNGGCSKLINQLTAKLDN
ncbi:MAG: C-GCAxxG-C-C family protein [Bacteroidales bacterium]|nr:C-GCAxxG-C-C family protein [Bacteroidales bacterium]